VRTSYAEKPCLSRVKIVDRESEGLVRVQMPLPMAGLMVDLQGELQALVWETGKVLMQAIMESEVERMAGQRYAHIPERKAGRAGHARGWVFYSGRKVPLSRPRVRDDTGEVGLSSVAAFQTDGPIQRAVAGKVISGVKMRRYEQCLDDVCEGYGIKKSSVSRHWVEASARKVRELMERELDGLKLVAIVIDGIRFREVLVIVALGVDWRGYKHVLGLYPGATENATTCQMLLDDMIGRGLNPKCRYLFIIDGSKALRQAIRSTFGEDAVVQRCQVHKKRNVKDHLEKTYHRVLSQRLSAAYGMADYADAKAGLDKTIRWLEEISPSAAESLREGLEETLTLHRLEVPYLLRLSLSSTNLIESCFSTTRERSASVKRWRGQDQVMRWAGSVLMDAEAQFKRVRGYVGMSQLMAKLGIEVVETQEAVA